MIHFDLISCFAIGGVAALLGLGILFVTKVDQARVEYALTLYRWAFVMLAFMLLGVLAPASRMPQVFQAIHGCLGMGLVLLGWASRQLQGKRTRPEVGWGLTALVGLSLWAAAWWLPDEAYLLVLDAVFLAVSLLILLDHGWVILRNAKVAFNEWMFLLLAGGWVLHWLLLLIHALRFPSALPVHWLWGPAWWMPLSAVAYALMPLALAGLVSSVVNERLSQQLRTRSLSDELTGALSRKGLRELGERMLASVSRPYSQIAVLVVDVDHFKKVNDTYGHLVGDEVLRHVVGVMQDRLRDDALLARYGGEEFVVLAPVRQPHEARVVAERLRQSVEKQAMQTTAGLVKTTVSVGAAFHSIEDTLEQTLAVADARLLEAKQAGRNRVVVDEPQTDIPTLPPAIDSNLV